MMTGMTLTARLSYDHRCGFGVELRYTRGLVHVAKPFFGHFSMHSMSVLELEPEEGERVVSAVSGSFRQIKWTRQKEAVQAKARQEFVLQ